MNLPQSVLIVEDEVITQRYLQDILTHYSIGIAGCYDSSDDLLDDLDTIQTDMVLMDINIKGSLDGIALAQRITDIYTVPVIFVTAYNDYETFQEVLKVSPYGFVNKPFQSKDIYITMQLAFRRFLSSHKVEPIKHSSDIEIDSSYRFVRENSKLYCDGELVQLTPKQNSLIELLATNLDITITADRISDIVWIDEYMSNSSLRSLIHTIRKQHPNLPLKSDSKRGYYLSRHG